MNTIYGPLPPLPPSPREFRMWQRQRRLPRRRLLVACAVAYVALTLLLVQLSTHLHRRGPGW